MSTSRKTYEAGFTLIETLLYIALFGMLMSGVVVAAYQLMVSARKSDTSHVAVREADFVMHKIEWALDGVTSYATPSAAAPFSTTLDVVSGAGVRTRIRINPTTGYIEMSEQGHDFVPITTDAVVVSVLHFHYLSALSGKPQGIEASTTIQGIPLVLRVYSRI